MDAFAKVGGQSWANGVRPWVIVGITMTVDAQDLRTYETDDRGRIYLGTEYANKRITVAVVDVERDRLDEDELAAAYRDASERAATMAEEWNETSDEADDELIE